MSKTTTILASTLTLWSACKRVDAVPQTSPAAAAVSASGEKDGSDTPSKPAPVAGAYLTSIITKPKVATDVDIGVQLRSSDGRRYIDSDVNKGKWAYLAAPNVPLSDYTVSILPLTNKQQRYYFHADVRVHLKSDSAASAQTMTRIVSGMHMVFIPPVGKPLKGITPYAATELAQQRSSPFATPQAVVDSPYRTLNQGSNALASILGALIAPQDTQTQPLSSLPANAPTQGGVPPNTDAVPPDQGNTQASTPQDLNGLYSQPYPTDPTVGLSSATYSAPQTASAGAPYASSDGTAATGTEQLPLYSDCLEPTLPDATVVMALTAEERNSIRLPETADALPNDRMHCAGVTAESMASGRPVVTLEASPFYGCVWICAWPPPN